ncbi:MAG: response regulator transcription factor, partial [Actinomycetota bacterium]|nr:response regulator transcription factor [Actinomycetota bacterium]
MGTLKVVVVDDHQLMLEAVELALGDDDIEIVGVARSGAQALPVIARTQPDIVLLDLRMPDMDGLTCLELIRQRFPSVKVVMLSGAEEPELIEACLRRG